MRLNVLLALPKHYAKYAGSFVRLREGLRKVVVTWFVSFLNVGSQATGPFTRLLSLPLPLLSTPPLASTKVSDPNIRAPHPDHRRCRPSYCRTPHRAPPHRLETRAQYFCAAPLGSVTDTSAPSSKGFDCMEIPRVLSLHQRTWIPSLPCIVAAGEEH
jgi:hypothetical protein